MGHNLQKEISEIETALLSLRGRNSSVEIEDLVKDQRKPVQLLTRELQSLRSRYREFMTTLVVDSPEGLMPELAVIKFKEIEEALERGNQSKAL